ncbi:MAG: hypothetical protein IH804_04020 [Planctomycetes bacterium]|nr:hypothetical protein [Planctomycetota bacterium]
MGTFPENGQLGMLTGQKLADLNQAGVAIFVASGDMWGFDPATPFEDYDGVENSSFGNNSDGDDSCNNLTGQDSGQGLDVSTFDALYNHDQSGNEWTDRIAPTGEFWAVRPMKISAIMMGRPTRATHSR